MSRGVIETFEESHVDQFARAQHAPWPTDTWRTPDGTAWAPQMVLQGWQTRLSDRWACLLLHEWIRRKLVRVHHVELLTPLMQHAPGDAAWQQIARMGDDAPALELTAPFGRADLAFQMGKATCMVEFGSCAPVKFVLNVGLTANDWMIVPFGCAYAFVFTNVSGNALFDLSAPSRKEPA